MAPDAASGRAFGAILCPVDFSSNSRAALRYSVRLAQQSDCRLVVLFVEDPLLAVVAARRRDAETVIRAGERDLRSFVMKSVGEAAEGMPITLVTSAGKPPAEIVKAARRHGCDLIVMGYRGIGRASRFFFGSTTEGVVRTARVPVLAIPPRVARAKEPSKGPRGRGTKRGS